MSTRVLILCTGNACRSQMAEGFLRSFNPSLEVFSAGISPSLLVHPLAVRVMQEAGIDISGAEPKSVDLFVEQSFDYVITVCDDANEACPVFSGDVRNRLHIGFEDPARAEGSESERLAVFRRIRDQIRERFRELAQSLTEEP
jgi:arsenate reductase